VSDVCAHSSWRPRKKLRLQGYISPNRPLWRFHAALSHLQEIDASRRGPHRHLLAQHHLLWAWGTANEHLNHEGPLGITRVVCLAPRVHLTFAQHLDRDGAKATPHGEEGIRVGRRGGHWSCGAVDGRRRRASWVVGRAWGGEWAFVPNSQSFWYLLLLRGFADLGTVIPNQLEHGALATHPP